MKKRINLFFILFFLCSYLSYSQQTDKILVNIGNEVITVEEFVLSFQKNNQLSRASEKELREYLDLYINFRLKVKEGKALQIDTAINFQKEFAAYRKQSAQQYLIDKDVSERLINEAKERLNYYIRASHIMMACDQNAAPKDTLAAYQKALDIRNKILNKEMTFAQAAVRFSDDLSAKDTINPSTGKKQYGNKGDLGYFTVFSLIYPFENGAYNTPVNSISMPVRSIFGYHLIYVQDKIEAIERVSVAQIFVADTLAYKGIASPETKNKLETIQQELRSGKSFEDVVKEYSDDPNSRDNGGVMEPFQLNRRPGDFVKAAISLNAGEISKPVATIMGWHILKLIDILPQTMTDDEATFFVRTRVSRDSRSHLSKESFIAKLKREYQYTELQKEQAIKFLEKNIPDEFFVSNQTNIQNLPKIGKLKPMAQFANQKIMAPDFVNFLTKFRGVNLKESKRAFLEKHFNMYAEETLTKYEDARLEEKHPEFKELMNEYENGMILYEINSKNVWEKAMQDSIGLLKFYESIKTEYPAEEPNDTIQYKPLNDFKATIITRYQDYLDGIWVEGLKEKYPVTIREEVFRSLKK